MRLNILSWNIWCDGHFDEVSRFLGASGADIIGLQEVLPEDATRNVIGYLTNLGYEHVFSPALKIRRGFFKREPMGNAIFSRYPIVGSETYALSEIESRVAVRADVNVGETVVHVFNTHLLHTHQRPSIVQDVQAANLIKVLLPARTIVMGDFNATPESAAVRRMRGVLVDADPESKPTWSVYPEGCGGCKPQAIDTRLDYIFASRDLATRSFSVGISRGSDHLPISVVVEV
jgi:endonuclease/exonuclease/phosphatase family metal-dependent hydrolase